MLSPHPFADIFPMLDKARGDELRDDIAAHGLRDPVVLFEGMILDGRNRYGGLFDIAKLGLSYLGHPLTAADLVPGSETGAGFGFFEQFKGTEAEALEYVLSKNLHRRHLNESQRAMVAAGLATLQPGRPSADNAANLPVFRQSEAAEKLAVSERSVRDARAVKASGVDGLNEAVTRGEMRVSEAAMAVRALSSLPADEQARIIRQNADPKALSRVTKELRADKQREKAERRGEKERALAGKQRALPQKRYGVILADPEWKYLVWSLETGRDRSPDNHYPTSTLEEIMARPVADIAADDSILMLWVTIPFLAAGLAVLEAWGFRYVTHVVWIKERPGEANGTGYWFWGEHEIVLIGKRGNPPAPTPGTQFPSYFVAPVGEHSAKPDRMHEIAEAYFPNFLKIELNARRARPGWDAWGNEAEGDEDAIETPFEDISTDDVSLAVPSIDRDAGLLCDRGDSSSFDHQSEVLPTSGVDPVSSAGTSGDAVSPARRVRVAKAAPTTSRSEEVGNPVSSPISIGAVSPDARLVELLGEAVALALNLDASLRAGDSRFHSADERLIRRHVIRIAADDFKVSCPRLAAVLGGSKQGAAKLRLAAIGEIEADTDLAAKLSKVADHVAGGLAT